MSLMSRNEAMASIVERKRTVKGKEYPLFDVYLGINEVTRKPVRLFSSTKRKLKERIDEFYKSRGSKGDAYAMLRPDQLIDANFALQELARAGMSISLTECVRRVLEHSSAVLCEGKTLGEAYDEFYAAKEKSDSPSELEITRKTTGRFVERFSREHRVDDLFLKDVVDYLKTYYDNLSPSTYNKHLGYISTFLSWCAKPEQGYIKSNPISSLKKKKVAWKKPKYLPVDQVERLFRLLESPSVMEKHPEYLALAVTQFFVGVRREEALRIADDPDSATIIIEDETFRVDGGKGYTKGKAPRAAHLQPNAVEWMKSFDYKGSLSKIVEYTTDSMYAFARKNGIEVFHNCARHTFITMHVARFHQPEVTQAMVGTSGTMRAAHYDGLASEKEGTAYFSISPTARTA